MNGHRNYKRRIWNTKWYYFLSDLLAHATLKSAVLAWRFSNFDVHQNNLEGLLSYRQLGSMSGVSNSVGLGWGLIIWFLSDHPRQFRSSHILRTTELAHYNHIPGEHIKIKLLLIARWRQGMVKLSFDVINRNFMILVILRK
jgi:hypothetical protein